MNHRNFLRTAGAGGLLAVLMTGLAPLSAEPLRVPAFTAYTLPDAEGARISERSGVTRWTDPALSVNWYGQFKKTGELTARIELRLAPDTESKLKLTVAGQSCEVTVRGAGPDTRVIADFGWFDIAQAGYQRFALESLSPHV